MNKITALFKNKQENILSIYFTAGFPQINSTISILEKLQASHVDMVEIGIPFSDPIADGKIIQESNSKALKNGMSLKFLMNQLEIIKDTIHIPMIIMGYLNSIIQYGFENFCRDCQKNGISGIIIPDLPVEEYINRYKSTTENYQLKIIFLITPNTSEKRIHFIDNHSDGFIYVVSTSSTTGMQVSFDNKKKAYFYKIRQMNLRNPLLIGFGVSNKETLSVAFEYASGAIIGSKFISLLMEENCPEKAIQKLITELTQKPIKNDSV